jgi:Dynactin subunit p22
VLLKTLLTCLRDVSPICLSAVCAYVYLCVLISSVSAFVYVSHVSSSFSSHFCLFRKKTPAPFADEKVQQLLVSDRKISDIIASLKSKERIILFSEKDFKTTAEMLKVVQSLQVHIDKIPFASMPNAHETAVRADIATDELESNIMEYHSGVEQLVDTYSRIISETSRALLYWDAKLTEMGA